MNGNILFFWIIVTICISGYAYGIYTMNNNIFFFFIGGMVMLCILIIWSVINTKIKEKEIKQQEF